MNPQQPRSEDSDWAEWRLDYRSGAADLQPIKKRQVVGGIVISVVLCMGTVFIAILTIIGRNASSRPLFVIVGGAALLINLWAFLAYRNQKTRGLGLGLWIGFGLAALIEGACFGFARI